MKKIMIAFVTLTIILTLSACLNDPFAPEATDTPTPALKNSSTKRPDKKTDKAATPELTATPFAQPTETPTAEPTPEPTATPLPPTDTLASGTNIYAFGGGQGTLTLDLNKDGTPDTITYEFLGQAGPVPSGAVTLTTPFLNMMNYDIYQLNLEINGQPIIIQGEVMAGLILIGDIDTQDDQYEIMVAEFGPSGDPFTTFIAYNGTTPINIGKIYQNPLMDLTVDGNKIITGQKRGEKLHTWFYEARYRLAPAGLIREIKKDGLVMMGTVVTAKVDLPLQMSPTDTTPAFTLSAGENATITWTDDDTWFCIEKSGGLKGWFSVTGFYEINGLPATDVFDGLLMAD